jgi:hypothetical protein
MRLSGLITTFVVLASLAATCFSLCAWSQAADGQPHMTTPWADDVDPDNVLGEYPRPQMVRDNWVNLNGLWRYGIRPRAAADDEPDRPFGFDGQILVPFPAESLLSRVTRPVRPDELLWYERSFAAPQLQRNQRLLLHFGAVDWEATVWVNGQLVGTHRGGFDPFSFDITDALNDAGPQTVLVRVWDPTSEGTQPRGKQVLEPGGIVYTAVTGIWQTVWLEVVPSQHIESLKLTPQLAGRQLTAQVKVAGGDSSGAPLMVRLAATGNGQQFEAIGRVGEAIEMSMETPRAWHPRDPFLYDLKVELLDAEGRVIDHVESYFGMRDIEVKPDQAGVPRIFLNGEPEFQLGPLDQGWWPDGLYTAPTDEALRFDIELTKKFGFNMCRKHVKVEPARWYHWCDKLGLLVWQDMPSGDHYIGPSEPDGNRTPESEAVFRHELQAMIDSLHNSPSIVVWVPFNEGWGQFKTNEILNWVIDYDPTRVVDGPSGWADRGVGHLHDMHFYPGPSMFPVGSQRASVLGEFGGLGLPIEGHLWQSHDNWGYQTYDSQQQLTRNYRYLIDSTWYLKQRGLAAAVYTQTTDVEGEVNGLVTYDRRVVKIDPESARGWAERLYDNSAKLNMLLDTSSDPQGLGGVWQYTTSAPAEGWMQPGFDTRGWNSGRAGFGSPGTPGAVVRTEWLSSNIWLRRTFEVPDPLDESRQLYLVIHHDEKAEVYLNGTKVSTLPGYTIDYTVVALEGEARTLLKPGKNLIALSCEQLEGGQYIDVGLLLCDTPRSSPSGDPAQASARDNQAPAGAVYRSARERSESQSLNGN